ncbi:Ribonuclease M5 [Mycoplasma feriruminatoris]|uniref:Ribonuclease M5 n=2 Tax=Mycoplasma feriruminatoris TaxID=1179777 RepID=A0AAX3TE49_9MOLU|nr:ribonuclease M5 [Mycoplasma feriruminatoris]UKS53684.1 ribonuclease M5 [Mycoplasma feriruminatoris]WFQ91422.1 Ribonuclease M5 [Mycoplasma feriruminatoris]WFQ92248.1 Ribonuclease M5 [Mycoplasma feriruminatoris]WFQ93118.1 ribonuclease M5 [Mycoplasma feriruminatoris]WFQ95602.1 ribonuclease M5 [Mycoplasma feriruminatoris]
MKTIKQIIIVEGKSDTDKLKKIYGNDLKTIQTKGLSLNKKTLEMIKELNNKTGVIIFTDPDGAGKKIRQTIIDYLDNKVLNAFISKDDINKNSKKIGIAEASDQAIKKALDNLISYDKNNNSLSWSDYVNNDFYLKENRIIICKYFNFDENISSKTLFKWLNWMNISINDIKKIIGE